MWRLFPIFADIMKEYKIRIYIEGEKQGLYVNYACSLGAIKLSNSFDGLGSCLAIYDGVCEKWVVGDLISHGIRIFPLDNYGEYDITFMGESIEDGMILKVYDEKVLKGYNVEKNGVAGKANVLLK